MGVIFDKREDINVVIDRGTIQYGKLTIGEVTTGEAGTSANVVNVGTSSKAILNFTIPRGEQGIQGIQGEKGDAYVLTEQDKTNIKNEIMQDANNDVNKNAEERIEEFNSNADNKLKEYNDNSESKISEYNQNASDKTDVFNLNSTTKTDEFNSNVETKTTEFNTNASEKVEEFNSNAENKVSEFNSVVDEVIPQLESEITELQTEVNELKDNVLTNEVEGTSIHVEDSASARVLDLDIEGNSYQETSVQGKNLFDTPKEISRTINGLTFTVNNDGSVTIKGTSTAITQFYIDLKQPIALNGEYTFSLKTVGSISTDQAQQWIIRNSESENLLLQPTVSSNTTKKSSNTVSDIATKIEIYTKKDITFDCTIYPQLELNSTYTEWEQFIPNSPSPDYPSEVEVVKGYNLFDKDNANILNLALDGGNGTILNNNNGRIFYMEIPADTDNLTISRIAGQRFAVGTINSIPSIGSTCLNYVSNHTYTRLTIPVLANSKYLVVYYYLASADTLTEQEILDSIQIVRGTEVKPYVPYKNIGVKTTGENLLNIYKESTNNNYPDVFEILDNDWIHYVNNTGNAKGYYFLEIEVESNTSYYINVEKNITTGTPFVMWEEFDKNKGKTTTVYPNTSRTITTNSATKYVRVGITSSGMNTVCDYKMRLLVSKGNAAPISYSSFQENITYIDLEDNEICKVGDIKDELDLTTGILTKRIGKVVLDGSEEGWGRSNTDKTSTDNIYRYSLSITDMKIGLDSTGISSHFINPTRDTYFEDGISGSNNSHSLWIRDKKFANYSVEQIKTWLSENPVTVYYQLATPYEVQLGKIEMPKTIKNVTNINLLATLESNMKLKYVQSTNTVINNLAKAIVALGGEV